MNLRLTLFTLVALSNLPTTLSASEPSQSADAAPLTAEQRKEFLSCEKQLKSTVEVLGVGWFSNQQDYDKAVMTYYNNARTIMNQPVAKSIDEVSFRWARQWAQKLTPPPAADANVCDISGLDRKQVLQALYSAATPQGPHALGRYGSHQHLSRLTDAQAEEVLKDYGSHENIEYLNSRVMKIRFSEDGQLDVERYNENNGHNAAQNALKELMQTKPVAIKIAPAKTAKSLESKV